MGRSTCCSTSFAASRSTFATFPIARITAQYFEYMEKARQMDMDLGAEFVYMAATLIYIKSKMLLPQDPALAGRGRLGRSAPGVGRSSARARKIQERRRDAAARSASSKTTSGPTRRSKRFSRKTTTPASPPRYLIWSRPLAMCSNAPANRPVYEVESEDVSVADMLLYLKSVFSGGGRWRAGLHSAEFWPNSAAAAP